MSGRLSEVVFHLLEITLISAQGLKPPPSASTLRRIRTYAVAWVDPSAKLRTLVDSVGGENPTWNEKFLFRVPAGFLAPDSSSAVHIEIYAVGLFVDSLVGAVDFLVGNQRLLSRPLGGPSFAAVGIRRPSGRFHGVLNLGSAILPLRHVSALAAEAIARRGGDAVCYRVLMRDNPGHKIRRQRLAAPAESSSRRGSDPGQDPPRVLKEWNAERGSGPGLGKTNEENQGNRRKSSLDPSDQNSIPTKARADGGP